MRRTLLQEHAVDLNWSEEKNRFRCVLGAAPTPFPAGQKRGASDFLRHLPLFAALGVTSAVSTWPVIAILAGAEVGRLWWFSLAGVGLTLWLMTRSPPTRAAWLLEVHAGRVTVHKGRRCVFSSGLEALEVYTKGSQIHLSGHTELTLNTDISPKGILKLEGELNRRADRHGERSDAPSQFAERIQEAPQTRVGSPRWVRWQREARAFRSPTSPWWPRRPRRT